MRDKHDFVEYRNFSTIPGNRIHVLKIPGAISEAFYSVFMRVRAVYASSQNGPKWSMKGLDLGDKRKILLNEDLTFEGLTSSRGLVGAVERAIKEEDVNGILVEKRKKDEFALFAYQSIDRYDR